MSTTSRFALPLIAAGQAQKETYHNEALAAIDAAIHACVEAAAVTDPPTEPIEGESWLVAGGAIGDWAGQDDSLATWTGGVGASLPPCPA